MDNRIERLLQEALSHYDFRNPQAEFIRYNENATYKLTDAITLSQYVLRIHQSSDSFSLDVFGLQLPGTRGIAHTDLSKSNMIVCDSSIAPIDFGLCGFSHSYMDLGSLFSHLRKPEERRMLLYGYETILSDRIEARFIEPFMALQILLFIASHYEKALEWDWFDDAMHRWGRETFQPLAAKEPFIGEGSV